MRENEFEHILINNLDLIEHGLAFKGNQVNCHGKRVDILCEDRHGQILIVEVKKVAIRKDVAQLLDYAGHYIADADVPIRVMLVALRIPENFKRSFDYFGIEYLELPESDLPIEDFDEQGRSVDNELREDVKTKSGVERGGNPFVRNQTRQDMGQRIKNRKLFRQAKLFMQFLLEASEPMPMNKITVFINEKGYTSKGYYDLANALKDNNLISNEKRGRHNHYFILE